MESLPLMLQFALLLLGCGLSLYLWGINTAVASVVIGITSFGAIFYTLIVIAGATFVSCPYQTPGAQILRHIPPILRHIPPILRHIPPILRRIPPILQRIPLILRRTLPMFHSAFFSAAEISCCIRYFIELRDLIRNGEWTVRYSCRVLAYLLLLPISLAYDAYISMRTIAVGVLTLPRRVHNWYFRVYSCFFLGAQPVSLGTFSPGR